MKKIFSLASAAAAAAMLVAMPAHANSALTGTGTQVLAPVAQSSSTLSFDVSGAFSNDGIGDPVNEVYLLDVGTLSTITSVGWNVVLTADAPSWVSEMMVDITSTNFSGVTLNPGEGADVSGTQAFSSDGMVDLVNLGLSFQVGEDGMLRLEFWERFDDFPNEFDGLWESGTLSFGVSPIPEPATYGLMALGMLAVVVAARRRRQD